MGMPNDFSWAVKDEASANDYANQERSDGEVVTGSYRVLLPDGRTQVVTYRVQGDSGFVAEFKYEGEACWLFGSSNYSAGNNQLAASYGAEKSSSSQGSYTITNRLTITNHQRPLSSQLENNLIKVLGTNLRKVLLKDSRLTNQQLLRLKVTYHLLQLASSPATESRL